MKKRMTSVLALMMAMTMVFGSALTVHAEEDGCYHGTGVSAGENDTLDLVDIGGGSSDSDNSDSSSSESYSEPASNESYDDGCYHGTGVSAGSDDNLDLVDYSSSSDSGSYDSGSSSSSGTSSAATSAAAPAAVKKAAGSNTGVTGKEQFRALAKSGQGSYKVTHKGQTIATFWLTDSEGKSVSCDSVNLKQREDGKWAIDYKVKDATGLTVGAPLDRTYMYKTLGVSYVTINDEVIIDIEAEAAAKTTK